MPAYNSNGTTLNRGSSTATTVVSPILTQPDDNDNSNGTLRLQGDSTTTLTTGGNGTQPRRGIRWDEEVVDNEHMNKKKSKSKLLMIDFC